MSKIRQIQELVRNGLYYLTEHADDEAMADNFDIYDVEYGILTGRVRRTWPREGKYDWLARPWTGVLLVLFVALLEQGKFGSLLFTRIEQKSEGRRNCNGILER